MNPFLISAKRLVDRHGKNCTLIKVTEGELNTETMTVSNTETSYTVKMFKNHIKANQFHFPNLVGKDSAEFYLVNTPSGSGCSPSVKPEVKDKINYDNVIYTIDSINENYARGELVLYRLVSVKN
jgi:hypothetical protein